MDTAVTPREITDLANRRNAALDAARRYANLSRASSTWRAYESDWRQFTKWCNTLILTPLPAAPETLCSYLAYEADAGKAISTLRRRLSAIRLMHVANNLPSPHESAAVSEVLQGIARDQRGRKPRQAAAALAEDVCRMVDTLDLTTMKGLRDRALLLVGFDGALRPSELVGIRVEDIDRREKGLIVTLPWSKTDQTGEGQAVGILIRDGSPYCPVAALDTWLDAANIREGAVFRRVYRSGRIGIDALSVQTLSLFLKSSMYNVDSNSDWEEFSGHSLRRGYVTSAIRSGMPTHRVMQQTRHRNSSTIDLYIEKEELLDAHVAEFFFT